MAGSTGGTAASGRAAGRINRAHRRVIFASSLGTVFGFLPVTSFAIVAATGNIYAGLWYPIAVALLTVLIGSFFLRETLRTPAGTRAL